MTHSTNRLGRCGENLAVGHLEAAGYRILARNWRAATIDVRGELDVVAADGDTLVFVEVKSRRRSQCDDAFAGVNWSKQRQLRRLAGMYLAGQGAVGAVRFDVVAVAWPEGGGAADVQHIRDAF